jgi:hypothetical protein
MPSLSHSTNVEMLIKDLLLIHTGCDIGGRERERQSGVGGAAERESVERERVEK